MQPFILSLDFIMGNALWFLLFIYLFICIAEPIWRKLNPQFIILTVLKWILCSMQVSRPSVEAVDIFVILFCLISSFFLY